MKSLNYIKALSCLNPKQKSKDFSFLLKIFVLAADAVIAQKEISFNFFYEHRPFAGLRVMFGS